MHSQPPLLPAGEDVTGPRGVHPPYYAVIFTSRRSEVDEGYAATADRMLELASRQPGFLGVDSVWQGAVGITVSYWTTEEAIALWRRDLEHLEAQRAGRQRWYEEYQVQVARVERAYGFRPEAHDAAGSHPHRGEAAPGANSP